MSVKELELSNLRDELDERGYLLVDGIFDPRVEFAQLYADWNEILDEIADECIADGSLRESYQSLPFEQRFLKICAESGRNFPRRFDIALPQQNIRPDTPIYAGSGIFQILTNNRLLDVIEALIGPEITSNPIQHVRMKLPTPYISEQGRSEGLCTPSPFHQDQSVALPEADDSNMITCWVAINDADEENACLQVYPRTAHAELITHCPADTPAMKGQKVRGVPPRLMPAESPTPVPVKAGGALLFRGRVVHGSFENFSLDRLRISLDLRFQQTGFPTGRPGFPAFVARSRANPESELRDPNAYQKSWLDARLQLATEGVPPYYRWGGDAPACA